MPGALVIVTAVVAALSGQMNPVDQSHAAGALCLRAQASLAMGAVPRSQDFLPVACPGERLIAVFEYDTARGSSKVRRQILQDQIVPVFPEFGLSMILPGEPLRIVVKTGATRVVREVQAMQAARSGQKLFVRSGDGQIFSARYESDAP